MPLHPIIQRVLRRAYYRGHAELSKKSLHEVRQYYEQNAIPALNKQEFEDIVIQPAINIRLHRPFKASKPLPLVMYLRPNAYLFGKKEDADYFGYYLAKYLKCIVAVIELRLAPEYKFPIQFDDCIASIQYLLNHHETLKIDAKRMAIWGESSGGNMAAAVCQHLKKEKAPIISQQILFYPMLDYHQFHLYPSKQEFGEGYMMDTDFTAWLMMQYTTSVHEHQDLRISPLLADNFGDLPETLIVGAQYDPFRDETAAYYQALIKSKVSAHTFFLPGMIHGFLWYTDKIEVARFAQRYAANFLKQKFKES